MKSLLKITALAALLAISSCSHYGKGHCGSCCGDKTQCSMKDKKDCDGKKAQCPMTGEAAKNSAESTEAVK